jgi:integrase
MQEQRTTVGDILNRYEAECLEELAPRTQKDYRKNIVHLRRWFGDRIADDLRPRDFGPFLNVKRGYYNRVKMLAILSSAFTNAVSTWFMMERNVLRDVKRKPGKPRDRLISDAEFRSNRAMAPLPVQLAMNIALITGQRQGDILGMRWDQIKDGAWHMQQSKTGKRLAIGLSLELKKILGKCAQLECDGERTHVILSTRGRPYTSDGFRAVWQRNMRRWMRATGSPRFTFHDIRALCATRCGDPHVAMRLLGHTNIAMTMRTYRRGIEHVQPLDI